MTWCPVAHKLAGLAKPRGQINSLIDLPAAQSARSFFPNFFVGQFQGKTALEAKKNWGKFFLA